MSFIKDIFQKTTELSDAEFDYSITSDFNFIDSLNEDCTAIVMEATVVYFEIKNIPVLLKTGKRHAARVYKIYYNALHEICKHTGGFFNCYSPTSFLMIYPKEKFDLATVVNIAMKTADLISIGLREPIEKLCHNNFSIGVDHGNILGTKTLCNGKSNQIVWFGRTIEKAITISSLSQRPFFVGISSKVFHDLDESMTKTTKHILGIKKEVDVWTRMSYQFENVKKHLYQTNFHKSFEEE